MLFPNVSCFLYLTLKRTETHLIDDVSDPNTRPTVKELMKHPLYELREEIDYPSLFQEIEEKRCRMLSEQSMSSDASWTSSDEESVIDQ